MRDEPIVLPPVAFAASDRLFGWILDVRRFGLTLASIMEPGALKAERYGAEVGQTIQIVATDGWTWARYVGVTELGRIVLDPIAHVVSQPSEAGMARDGRGRRSAA